MSTVADELASILAELDGGHEGSCARCDEDGENEAYACDCAIGRARERLLTLADEIARVEAAAFTRGAEGMQRAIVDTVREYRDNYRDVAKLRDAEGLPDDARFLRDLAMEDHRVAISIEPCLSGCHTRIRRGAKSNYRTGTAGRFLR